MQKGIRTQTMLSCGTTSFLVFKLLEEKVIGNFSGMVNQYIISLMLQSLTNSFSPGVRFVFSKIDMQSPDKEYSFCIKLIDERYICELQVSQLHLPILFSDLHLCIDAEVLSLVNYSSPLCSLCAWLRRTCEGS